MNTDDMARLKQLRRQDIFISNSSSHIVLFCTSSTVSLFNSKRSTQGAYRALQLLSQSTGTPTERTDNNARMLKLAVETNETSRMFFCPINSL